MNVNANEPMIEMIAGSVSVAAEGSSAMITPTKPTKIAVQRRHPTRSPSSSGDNAAT